MMRCLRRLISGYHRANILEPYINNGVKRHTSRHLLSVSCSNNVLSRFTPPAFDRSCNASSGLANLANFVGQMRNMFIQTQSTPKSLMFYPGKPVMEVGSADFPNACTAMNSPLAKALYGIDGVTRVFFGSDFVTVTKSDDTTWDFLKPEIYAAIKDFYSSGKPLFLDLSTAIHEDDSEIVAMIKELLETRIRPVVQDDSGDIEYIGFDSESGIVKIKMQGACSGCPGSSITLKSGIENMLMHYVPEVKAVEQELDDKDKYGDLKSQLE